MYDAQKEIKKIKENSEELSGKERDLFRRLNTNCSKLIEDLDNVEELPDEFEFEFDEWYDFDTDELYDNSDLFDDDTDGFDWSTVYIASNSNPKSSNIMYNIETKELKKFLTIVHNELSKKDCTVEEIYKKLNPKYKEYKSNVNTDALHSKIGNSESKDIENFMNELDRLSDGGGDHGDGGWVADFDNKPNFLQVVKMLKDLKAKYPKNKAVKSIKYEVGCNSRHQAGSIWTDEYWNPFGDRKDF